MNDPHAILAVAVDERAIYTATVAGEIAAWSHDLRDHRVLFESGVPISGLATRDGLLFALCGAELLALSLTGPGTPRALSLGHTPHLLAHRRDHLALASDDVVMVLSWAGEGFAIKKQHPLELGGRATTDLDISPDGTRLLICGSLPESRPKVKEAVALVDAMSGRQLALHTSQQEAISARFAPPALAPAKPSSKRAKTAREEPEIYLGLRGRHLVNRMRVTSGRSVKELRMPSAWATPVAVSPDGRALAVRVSGSEAQVLLNDIPVFYAEPVVDRSQAHLVASLSRVPTFETFAPGLARVTRWLKHRVGDVRFTAISVSDEGARLALGARDGSLTSIDTARCEMICATREGAVTVLQEACSEILLCEPTRAIAVGQRRGLLFTVAEDGQVRAIHASDGRIEDGPKLELPPRDKKAWGPEGAWIVDDCLVLQWEPFLGFNVKTGAKATRADAITSSWTLADGVLEERSPTGEVLRSIALPEPLRRASSLTYAGADRWVLSDRGETYLFDPQTGEHWSLGHALEVYASQDGRHFALAGPGGGGWSRVDVRDARSPDKAPIFRFDDNARLDAIGDQPLDRFGALGRVMAFPAVDRVFSIDCGAHRIVVWDLKGNVLAHIAGLDQHASLRVFSEDGKSVITSNRDGLFRRFRLP